MPSTSSVGRSFSEWTARSISPSRSACSSSAVKSPLPPIAGSGSPLACVRSPCVDDRARRQRERRAARPRGARRPAPVCARASARAPRADDTAAGGGGALTARAGRRGRRARAPRPRPRPRRPRPRARAARTVGSCRSFFTSERERCSMRSAVAGSTSPRSRERALELLRRGSTPPGAAARRRAARPRARGTGAPNASDLLLDDLLDARHLAQPRGHRLVEPGPQVVDVEEPDARARSRRCARRRRGRRGRRGRAAAPRGRVIAAATASSRDDGSSDDVAPTRRRRPRRARPRARRARRRSRVEPRADLLARARACGSRPRPREMPRPASRLQRLQPDPAGSDHEGALLAAGRPSDSLGERQRHRARRRGVRADRGLRARPATGRDRRAEEQREHGPTVPSPSARLERVPTWPRISASPSTSESSPVATRHRWRATSSPAWT